MAIDSRYKMSQERLDTLKEELHYLETTREKEVAELIKEARSFGDLSENSEYDEAKNEQGKLYSRIAELDEILSNYTIIEEQETHLDMVHVGNTVIVEDLEFDEKTGCICALLLPDNKPFSFSRKPRFRVCLDWIEQFGKDLILICRYEELNACKKR